MNLTEMRALVRLDVRDLSPGACLWSDAEIDRHISRALATFSGALPLPCRVALPTVSGSPDIAISSITACVMLEAVEYPVGLFPAAYRRFTVWEDTLTLLDGIVPDGSLCHVYYGKMHTLDAQSCTVPALYFDLVAAGAAAYLALAAAVSAVNQVNTGGTAVPGAFLTWGSTRLACFHAALKRLGRRSRVRTGFLYRLG